MPLKVKICGLTREEAVIAALAAGADAVGLVFFPPSPRHISLRGAATLAQRVPNGVLTVGLFVDASDAALDNALTHVPLGALQLHGQETPERVAAVRARFGLPVIKALGVSDTADLDRAAAYDGTAEMLLFDAKPPKDARLPGGNARAFDWDLLAGRRWQSDWMLAGGLDPDNVADAVRRTGAPWVDVSSGVERRRGVKDAALITRFITNAKTA